MEKNKHKLLHRRGVCYLKLEEPQKAKTNFDLALQKVQRLDEIDEKTKKNWIKILTKCLEDCSKAEEASKESKKMEKSSEKVENIFALPSLASQVIPDCTTCSDHVKLQADEKGQTFVLANKKLEIGEVLVLEKPLASVLFADR